MTLTKAQGAALAQLGAEPVDVVVRAADADQVGPVDARGEQLLLLEIRGHEDVGVESRRGGVCGDGVGEVPGRGAGDRLETELLRLGDRHRDDAVLERVRRVGRIVLDPHLTQSEPVCKPVGADQRGEPGLERVSRVALEGQEVGIAPDATGAGLDLPPRLFGIEVGVVVRDLERAKALLTHEAGIERIALPALLAFQGLDCHWLLYVKNLRLVCCGRRFRKELSSHIFQALARHLLELAPSSNLSPRGLPGFLRASPSTPLDVVRM